MILRKVSIAFSIFAFSLLVCADDKNVIEKVRSQHPQLIDVPVTVNFDLKNYGLEGFYELNIGGQTMIVDKSGRYAFIGDFFDLKEMKNISVETRNSTMADMARKLLTVVPDNELVVFESAKGSKNIGTLFAFIDPTCGFSQQLHREIKEYLDAGVTVKYIPYPRNGVNNSGEDYRKLKKIMCADNKQSAFNDMLDGTEGAKYDRFGAEKRCHDIVEKGYDAGQKIGIQGTPFLYLSTGEIIPGYNVSTAVIEKFRNATQN